MQNTLRFTARASETPTASSQPAHADKSGLFGNTGCRWCAPPAPRSRNTACASARSVGVAPRQRASRDIGTAAVVESKSRVHQRLSIFHAVSRRVGVDSLRAVAIGPRHVVLLPLAALCAKNVGKSGQNRRSHRGDDFFDRRDVGCSHRFMDIDDPAVTTHDVSAAALQDVRAHAKDFGSRVAGRQKPPG